MKNSSNQVFKRNAFIGGNFNISVGHRRTPFGTNSMHTHDNLELTIYTEGRKTVCVNNSIYISEGGCAFTFRPDEAHCGIHRARELHERYVIEMYKNSFSALPDGERLLDCFFKRDAGEHNMIVMPAAETERCLALLNDIISLGASDEPAKEALMLADFINCMKLFNRYYLNPVRREGDIMPELLGQIISYISENLTSTLSVSGLQRHFGVSVSTIERLFRDTLLMSPKRFIFIKRIERAKSLLARGASVTDACYGAGFSDYSHFIADFRKETGVTPLKYRASRGTKTNHAE